MSWLFEKPASMDLRYSLKSDSPETLRRLRLFLPSALGPWDITATGTYAVCRPAIQGYWEAFREWIPRHMRKTADFGFKSIWEMKSGIEVPQDVGEFVSGSAIVPLGCRKADWEWLENAVMEYPSIPTGVIVNYVPLSHVEVIPPCSPDSPLPTEKDVKDMWGFLAHSGTPAFPAFSSWQPSFASFSAFPYPQFTAALLWSYATRGWFAWTPDDTFLMPGRGVGRTDLDWLAKEAKRSHKRRGEVEE